MDWHTIFLKGEQLSYLGFFIRASILYFMLFGANKAMGFRQPGIMVPYNFLMAAGISHIAAARMVDPQSRLIDAMVIIIVYTIMHLLISYLYFKFPSIVSQTPNILVKKGKVVKENLRKTLLTIDDLFSILRQKDVFNLQEVEYLIAEATGEFSVAKDSNKQPIIKSDMGIKTSSQQLSQILIYQGEVDKKVLERNDLDYNWLNDQLTKNNVSDIKEVYVGIITPDESLYINQ